MLVKVYAAALQGINAIQVTIEVNALRGIRFHCRLGKEVIHLRVRIAGIVRHDLELAWI